MRFGNSKNWNVVYELTEKQIQRAAITEMEYKREHPYSGEDVYIFLIHPRFLKKDRNTGKTHLTCKAVVVYPEYGTDGIKRWFAQSVDDDSKINGYTPSQSVKDFDDVIKQSELLSEVLDKVKFCLGSETTEELEAREKTWERTHRDRGL